MKIHCFILGIFFACNVYAEEKKNCDDFSSKYIKDIGSWSQYTREVVDEPTKNGPLVKFKNVDSPGPDVDKRTDSYGRTEFTFQMPAPAYKYDERRGKHKITIGKRDQWGNSQIIHYINREKMVTPLGVHEEIDTTIITLDKDCQVLRHSKASVSKGLVFTDKDLINASVNPEGCKEIQSLDAFLKKSPTALSEAQITQKLKVIEMKTGTAFTDTKSSVYENGDRKGIVSLLNYQCEDAKHIGMKIPGSVKSQGHTESSSEQTPGAGLKAQ